MDKKEIPAFFIEYVIYHEMLHYCFPVTINKQGRRIIHSRSFKEQERNFADYAKARSWEKENKSLLFGAVK